MAGPTERSAPRGGGIGAGLAEAKARARRSLLRGHGGGHAPVSNLELFFDLVYVFAITQISQFLHHHLSWHGLAEAVVLFLAVWWVWMYTTWVANWANPDRLPVRIMLLVLMLASLVLAVELPRAFSDRPLAFVLTYCAMQIGRTLCMAGFFGTEHRAGRANMLRIAAWFGLSAPLWLAGALAPPETRLAWWMLALTIEYAAPLFYFRVPFFGRSDPTSWDISGSHMAERCALFIIIALGEGIVVIGSSFASLSMESGRVAAFLSAFASSALLWWLYFDMGAERGARLIAGHAQAGRVARNAYTYLHMPIVLGVVITAVGDALMLEDWSAPAGKGLVLVLCGGLGLFLAGLGLFKRFANSLGNFPLSHSVAVVSVAGLAMSAWDGSMTALDLGIWCSVMLFAAAVWEWVSYHGGWIDHARRAGVPIPTWVDDRAQRRRERVEQQRQS